MGMNPVVVEMATWKHLEFPFSSKRVIQSQLCISGEIVDVSVATKFLKDEDWWFLPHPRLD